MSKSSVAKRLNKRFAKMSEDDGEWLLTQNECVIKLWIEASLADPFGENFKPLKTHLKETSFKRARLVLEDEGLFEFEPKYYGRDRRKIQHWMVKNLHGSEMDYWKAQEGETNAQSNSEPLEPKEIPCQERHAIDQERHAIDQERHAIDQERHAIESETLSLSGSYSPLDLIRLNETDRDLQKDSSSISRSGCSELAPCTKVTGSAPAPDAKLTREGNPEASLTDLPSSSSDLEYGLVSELGRREEEVPVQKMLDQCGQLNTISAAQISPAEPALEAPQNPPDPWDAQSDEPPFEPTLQPRIAPDPAECSRVYITVKHRLSEAGLLKGSWHKSLTRFQKELERGKLYPIVEGYKAEAECDEVPQGLLDDLVTDYLWHDGDKDEEPRVCVRRSCGNLRVIPWSKL